MEEKKLLATKEQFLKYEEIREEGDINMFDIGGVIDLSDGMLNYEVCMDIMKSYNTYSLKYLDVSTDNLDVSEDK